MAWRYFQNNTQPDTGLVNGQDNYPLTTPAQMGDTWWRWSRRSGWGCWRPRSLTGASPRCWPPSPACL
ncbi:DUF3131 domain-containing protein [Edwardsiella anguillarum]|nr:DUF3131 domain-containing protein [Edwardsiella anguillarum]